MLKRSGSILAALTLLLVFAVACGGSPSPPAGPVEPLATADVGEELPTALPPLTPPAEPPSAPVNFDQTWAVPIGAAYELMGVCQDAPNLAGMVLDEQLGEEMSNLGLVMLGNQLTVVNSGLADWQPTEAQAPFAEPLNQFASLFADTISNWVGQQISAAEAQQVFDEQCPAVATLLDDLNQLAGEEGVPEDYLKNLSETYQSMPSIFDFIGPE